jgi:hypothetical protein
VYEEGRSLVSRGLLADLHEVNVYVCAVQSRRSDVAERQHLKAFWKTYFERAGATVQAYSVLHILPDLN